MNNRSIILAASMLTVVLTACTATQEKTSYVEPASVTNTVTILPDEEYIARVERIARIRGAEVSWVHLPTKRIYSSD